MLCLDQFARRNKTGKRQHILKQSNGVTQTSMIPFTTILHLNIPLSLKMKKKLNFNTNLSNSPLSLSTFKPTSLVPVCVLCWCEQRYKPRLPPYLANGQPGSALGAPLGVSLWALTGARWRIGSVLGVQSEIRCSPPYSACSVINEIRMSKGYFHNKIHSK